MTRCESCAVEGHAVCWVVAPDRACSCCLETWFDMLVIPTRDVSVVDVAS